LPNSERKLQSILQRWALGFLALELLVCACEAQQYSFSTLTQGLGNLNVKCIAQDPAGYLWVGTENGLYRFDGREFREFGAQDGLPAHSIQSLFEGPDGTLFVGTTSGIYVKRLDGQFAQIRPPAPFTDFSQRIGTVFTALAADRVVTADRSGAFLMRRDDSGGWSAEAMHLDGQFIWSVLSAPDGGLWYGCDSDLCHFKDGKTTHLRAVLNLPEERWLHLLLARDGHLWIRGAAHIGEIVLSENRFEGRDLPVQSNAAPYSDLAQDEAGRVVASQGSAFGIWQNGHWSMITTANGLTHYDISNLFVDREGSLWFGVVGHGLTRWVGQDQWEGYTTANGLSDDIVWATLRDRKGRLWIGTESGLDVLLPGSNQAKPWQSSGVQTARSGSLAEGPDGAVWMGSAAGNLARIDPQGRVGAQWKVPEVYRVLSDGTHRVWAATDGGLFVVDTTAPDRSPHRVDDAAFAHPRQRFSDLTLEAVPGKPSRLWAAADDGIYEMDETGWHHVDPGLSGLIPSEIAVDSKGNLWASGAFPGVLRLRIEGGRVVESEHVVRPRLLSEQVVALLVDHRGWVWVGQDAGVSVFDGHNWRSLTQDDGLIWNDVDSYALAEDGDGSIWIGTSAGLSHLMHPQALSAGPAPAPVFSQITFGNKKVDNDAEIPWSASPLSISISTLSYRDASHMRIRYRLLGMESDWVETSERSLRYPRLEPGSYQFQTQAVDGTGGVLSPQQEISFVITPRWWQSGPLRLVVVLLTAVGVVLAWRWSLQLVVRQKRQLESAVGRRTEDLQREKTDLLHAREQMRHFAEHDDLTGLWNHRIIMERLRQEVDRSRRENSPISVILVDLDHFKTVNDTCGHPSGDLVLKEVGSIFARSVRSYDWVGRYGGEEFLLILPGSGFAGASVRAEELRAAVQAAYIHDGHRTIPITASFGVASGLTSNYEALIQAADAALYRAKGNGRNCVVVTETEPDEPLNFPV
jgi:diguanylate cyclase (GGDEF)-like protein